VLWIPDQSLPPAEAEVWGDNYPQLLQQIANLHQPLAKFFDDVMVMDDEDEETDEDGETDAESDDE